MKKFWFVPVALTILLIAAWLLMQPAGASPDVPQHPPVPTIDGTTVWNCTWLPISINTTHQGHPQVPANEKAPCLQTHTPEPTPTDEVDIEGTPDPTATATVEPDDDDDDDITLCHKPDTPAEKTMTVPKPAVDGHLGHGDYIGVCND